MTGDPGAPWTLASPVADLARAYADATARPEAVADACLERIDALQDRFRAFITVSAKRGRAEAAAAAKALWDGTAGPLAGIPYAVKDVFDAAGLPTTAGSRVPDDTPAEADSAGVGALTRAGAVLLGKTNLHEFAYGATGDNPVYGTPPNPWDETRRAGGSSSGSAVAVACGLTAFALGTDTGGSTRVPAALCGLVGLKPTYGLVDTRGIVPFCWTLDHAGIITRTAADAGLVLDALTRGRAGAGGATEGDLAGVTLGVPETHFAEAAEPAVLRAFDAARGTFEREGARIVDVSMPDLEHIRTVSLAIQLPEGLSYHRRYLPDRAELYGADIRAGLATGQFLLAEHYVRARRMVERYRRETDALFDMVDALVLPACPVAAPALETTHLAAGSGEAGPLGNVLTRFTTLFNMTGHPAAAVPAGMDGDGLPVSVQVVGRHYDDATVLRIAAALADRMPRPLPPAC